MWSQKSCFIMNIDFMNVFYKNSMIMKHEFHYFFPSMYTYVLRKKYKDFKGSQIAMNESLWEGRYLKLASTRNMTLPTDIKLAYEIRTLSIKKYDPVMGIIVILTRISVSNILKYDTNIWQEWFMIHVYEIIMIYTSMIWIITYFIIYSMKYLFL